MVRIEDGTAVVTVCENKLSLNKEAIDLLDAVPGERLAINYWNVNSEETFPVMGKSAVFTDSEGGNRLTKSKTVSYRGSQRDILLEYGEQFKLETFKEGIFRLMPVIDVVDNNSLAEELQDLENLEREDVTI